jgi:small-conductance mechanosensitive channel/CRP-like cAMP-binding protein
VSSALGVEPVFAITHAERTLSTVGFGGGAVLWMLAQWLLPKSEKPRSRLSLLYLTISLLIALVAWFLDPSERIARTLEFSYTFLLLASITRSMVLLLVDVVFGRRTHRAPPRIFRDLTQAVGYIVVLLLTLHAIGVEPGSLLTTSALLTAVVGLALQDTLGNMVSGLALQMQRPFEVGDWIQFEPDERNIGQVTEANWRATTVMTNDLVELIVPNAVLAKALIRNFSRPSPVSRRTVVVTGPSGTPPKRVEDAITSALYSVVGVLPDPKPYVQVRQFADSGVEYAVRYFIKDFATRDIIDAHVRERVWYALSRANVEIPFPTRMVHMHHVSEESERRAHERELVRRDQMLRCVDFLEVLPAPAHRALADASMVRLYSPGEIIVVQGDASGELFIIDRGEVVVELVGDGKPVPVARLGAKKFFGEMGLMTGEPRAATVRAATECELLVVGHDAFHEALASSPGIVEKMSDLLATRQAELEAVASERPTIAEPVQDRSRRLISQIKHFFKL